MFHQPLLWLTNFRRQCLSHFYLFKKVPNKKHHIPKLTNVKDYTTQWASSQGEYQFELGAVGQHISLHTFTIEYFYSLIRHQNEMLTFNAFTFYLYFSSCSPYLLFFYSSFNLKQKSINAQFSFRKIPSIFPLVHILCWVILRPAYLKTLPVHPWFCKASILASSLHYCEWEHRCPSCFCSLFMCFQAGAQS